MTRVGVVGRAGHTGVELLRLPATHPDVEVAAITSRGEAGAEVADHFRSLRGRCDRKGAGHAARNTNLMLGLTQTRGLRRLALVP